MFIFLFPCSAGLLVLLGFSHCKQWACPKAWSLFYLRSWLGFLRTTVKLSLKFPMPECAPSTGFRWFERSCGADVSAKKRGGGLWLRLATYCLSPPADLTPRSLTPLRGQHRANGVSHRQTVTVSSPAFSCPPTTYTSPGHLHFCGEAQPSVQAPNSAKPKVNCQSAPFTWDTGTDMAL